MKVTLSPQPVVRFASTKRGQSNILYPSREQALHKAGQLGIDSVVVSLSNTEHIVFSKGNAAAVTLAHIRDKVVYQLGNADTCPDPQQQAELIMLRDAVKKGAIQESIFTLTWPQKNQLWELAQKNDFGDQWQDILTPNQLLKPEKKDEFTLAEVLRAIYKQDWPDPVIAYLGVNSRNLMLTPDFQDSRTRTELCAALGIDITKLSPIIVPPSNP